MKRAGCDSPADLPVQQMYINLHALGITIPLPLTRWLLAQRAAQPPCHRHAFIYERIRCGRNLKRLG
jgi:hypothetical protein